MKLRWLHIALLPWSSWALSKSEAGIIDWQKSLIGVPHTIQRIAKPTFHRLQLKDGTTLAFLLTMTTSNTFAALDPVGGTLAWRQVFEPNDPVVGFRANEDGVATISGVGGANIRMFEVMKGAPIWEQKLHDDSLGRLLEPAHLGTDMLFAVDGTPDLLVLANGASVYRLAGLNGEVLWMWDTSRLDSMTLYTRIIPTKTTIYVVGLVKSFRSYTLSITALDATTGTEITTTHIPSSIDDPTQDILALWSRQAPLPTVVWKEGSTLRSIQLTSNQEQPHPKSGGALAEFAALVDVQLDSWGYFVAQRANGSASVMKQISGGSGFQILWDLPDLNPAASPGPAIYSGGVGKDGAPYISRVQWAQVLRACTMHLFAPLGTSGRGTLTGYSFKFETLKHGSISHAAIDVANPEKDQYIARFALTTSTGSFQLWQQDHFLWSREESLANIRHASFVDFPLQLDTDKPTPPKSPKPSRTPAEVALDLLAMPYRYIVAPADSTSEWRKKLGLRKMVVVVTSYGKVMALDSANGEILWGRIFTVGDTSTGPPNIMMQLFVIHPSSGDAKAKAQIAVVAGANPGTGQTSSLYLFDALTGAPVDKKSLKAGFAMPSYQVEGQYVKAFVLDDAVAVVDSSLQLHVYPASAVEAFLQKVITLSFTVDSGPGSHGLTGYKVAPTPIAPGIFACYQTWLTSFGQSQNIHQISKRHESPVASFGRVVGDRSTLYKFLDHHLVAAITTSAARFEGVSHACGVHLIDSVKGSLLYSTEIFSDRADCGIQVSLVDNWLVYYFLENTVKGTDDSKGHRLVSLEIYEGDAPDHGTESYHLSSFSNDAFRVHVVEKTFVLPYGVRVMSSTKTKYSISMKDIIVSTDRNQIQAIPRRLLDPRRPTGKPTPAELEEGLVPYDVLIPDDSRRTLSHDHEAADIDNIITAPVQLESTSLIFAFGLDLFQTRIAPSGTFDQLQEDFNRIQLVCTIVGLAAGIVITKPIVRSKGLNMLWY